MNTKLNFLMVLVLLVMLMGGNVAPAQAAEGDLDPTFGTGGVLAANTSAVIGGLFSQHTTTQQSDGKIIVGGSFEPAIAVDVWPQAELARYSADGVLDVDFGTGGKIDPQAPGATTSYVVGVYTGPQDEIIAVGGYGVDYGSPSRIYLARYDSAGEPVAGFGTGGVLSVALPYDLDAMIPWSGALQNDGKVLISGEYSIPNEYGGSFLMRLNLADGTLDSTFSNDGMVMSSYSYYASRQIMLQSDGKILITDLADPTSIWIYRYTSTGAPDESFGTYGGLYIPTSTQFQCTMLAEGTGGKLYLTAGPTDSWNSDFFLARLTANGAFDESFSEDGIVTTDLTGYDDHSCSLLVQADGKVIVGGGVLDADYNSWFALARYSADGVLDESFGSAGKVITTTDLPAIITELDITPGGKLLATGIIIDYVTFATVLARYDLVVPTNTAPTANPGGPYLGAMNTAIAFDGSLSSDPDSDSLNYAWTFGDGGTSSEVAPSHSYTAAGIYDVCLTVNDGALDSVQACTMAVVYDPAGGFVTGGGWIDSPEGAYIPDPSLSGKGSFGFVSKYLKGAKVPSGNTEFQFQAGSFNFHSTSYEWLVVSKDKVTAQFKGFGTVNGAMDPNGNAYKFMLWAGDGTPDTFRIRIWWEGADAVENVVYDNSVDQALGGGSIVVHTGK